ncbi:hypothetical protein [Streptomyces sp. 2A115]|uniref:hypothetical protein n=1 Tax=Streptomyces sp. 2A115 TaxID=3457439 RepID=UPI003FD43D7D
MSAAATPCPAPHFPEAVATDHARRQVRSMLEDLRSGAWAPTVLECRVAEILTTSIAADGMLSADRVRAALWEGNMAMTYANGGRFARALADIVPVLDHSELMSLDVVDTAGELVRAVAEQN